MTQTHTHTHAQAHTQAHTHIHTQAHTRVDSSGRVIGPSLTPLPDNTQHSQQTDISPAGYEPAIPESERTLTHALDLAANWIGPLLFYVREICFMTVFRLRTRDIDVWWLRYVKMLPEQTNAQGKAKQEKLSSDNLKRNSNLEDLNINRRVDNEADHSAYIGYITFELGLSFSGRSAVAKLQWNIKFHRTA